MYRRIILFFLFATIYTGSRAQITIALQVSPTGILQKNQLWNLALVNTSNSVVNVHVVMTLLDATSNQPVLTARTKVIAVSKGALQLKANDLSPIQYNYSGSWFNVDRSPDGFLAIGNYTACYTVYKQQYEEVVQLTEECIPVEVTPLSPPILNTPDDKSVLDVPYPQFTWLPPIPVHLFSDLSYNLVLTEVLKGQSANQAIQNNIPIYDIQNTKSLFNTYPSSNRTLDTGRIYAWRIIAKNRNQFVGQSDVWTFSINNKKPLTTDRTTSAYVKVARGYESAFTICTGNLKFEYMNDANDSIIDFKIIGIDDGKSATIKEGSLMIDYGQNLLNIPLEKERRIESNKTYMLKLINSRKEEWTLKFSYIEAKPQH